MAVIVILIIIFTSVFVIKNSFDISIMERIKQYGMLASIGATSKQIRKNVLFEGVVLGVIAIPLGILCGVFAIWVTLLTVTQILADVYKRQGFNNRNNSVAFYDSAYIDGVITVFMILFGINFNMYFLLRCV